MGHTEHDTSERILLLKEKYKKQNTSCSPTVMTEMTALFAISTISAGWKYNNLSREFLFEELNLDSDLEVSMSRARASYLFLVSDLRFDDRSTKQERKEVSRFAAIHVVHGIRSYIAAEQTTNPVHVFVLMSN